MIKWFIILGLLLQFTQVSAQRIFIVTKPSLADVIVYAEQQAKHADLYVFDVKHRHEAGKNNGLWFTALHPRLAEKKVYFAISAAEAQVSIFYVKDVRQAGWKNMMNKHFFD